MKKKTIGIIGGMGPWATADLYLKIVEYYQKNFGAKYDQDFPPFLIYSVPIPDVVESLENEKVTVKMLENAAKVLDRDGCDFILIACNTVQYLINKIQNKIKIPIIGIGEINARLIKKRRLKKVGILSTKLTLQKKIYEREFKKMGITLIKPNIFEREVISRVIMNQLAGKVTDTDSKNLLKIIKRLKSKGAEAVLIACTDLPGVIKQANTSIPLIDCTQVYADYAGFLSSASCPAKSKMLL
ncbi:amino acid racemase [Candidatus Microgenomates bacterium]|nr:amino acid racemase [Candidatus Microgenomates bacterium]